MPLRMPVLDEGQNVAVLIAMESELAIHHYLARWDTGWQLKEALEKSNVVLDKAQEAELETLCKNSLYFRDGDQTPSQHTSFVGNIMSSRISALWDFSGPSFTVSSGENSVFKAMEIAQNMLSLGEVDAVVVGGVDFSGGLENVLLRNKKDKVNSAKSPSLSLNKNDDGWLVGEGAGAVVLKKQSDAKNDRIYSVIDGIGKQKLLQNGGYLELAATGIEAQDKLEKKILIENNPSKPVALGSVKTNIGNTYAASGIASLIKTALCLHHRFIPGIPNWEAPKDIKAFEKSNYYFPVKSRPWILQDGQDKREAAVNGLDNLQIQLSEPKDSLITDTSFLRKHAPQLFLLNGNSKEDLLQKISALELAVETETSLIDIAQQFYLKSKEKESGLCIVLMAKSKADLQQEIVFFQKNIEKSFQSNIILKTPRGSYFTPDPLGKKGKLAFVYPGSSTAYTGLGKRPFSAVPGFVRTLRKIAA